MSEIAATRADWAVRITDAWRKSFEQIIETGRLLIEAKAALAHGEFLDMVARDLPFGATTAERLMAVGSDPRFAKSALGPNLPSSWRTLYELTKLADADFEARIAEGSIHHDMTRAEVHALLTGSRAGAPSAEPQSFATQMPVGDLVDTSPVIEGTVGTTTLTEIFEDAIGSAPPEMTEAWILDQAKAIRARRLLERRGAILANREANPLVGGTVADLEALAASGFKAGAILADPAWAFRTFSDAGKERSADMHYPTQALDEILALGPVVRALAADDCCLFLCKVDWDPAQALAVIDEWGFKHVTTAFTWAKLNPSGVGWHMGGGYWTRANPEEVWLGTKGDPVRLNAGVRQLIVAPVGEHSEKPEDYWIGIEQMVDGPYLELNARRARHGWVCWGNELPFNVNEPVWIGVDPGSGDERTYKFNVETGEIVDIEPSDLSGDVNEKQDPAAGDAAGETPGPAGVDGEGGADLPPPDPPKPVVRGGIVEVQYSQFIDPPTINVVSDGGPIDAAYLATEVRAIVDSLPDVTFKVLTIDGKPADIPILLEHNPVTVTEEPAGEAMASSSSGGQAEDDELEIPGFLRRQA